MTSFGFSAVSLSKVFLRNVFSCKDFFLAFYRLALIILCVGSVGYPVVSGKTDFFDSPWRFLIYALLVAGCCRKFYYGISGWLIPILIYGSIQLAQTSGARATAWSYALGVVVLAFLLSYRDFKAYRVIYWVMAFSVVICFIKVYFREFIVHGGRSSSGENVNVFGVNCALVFAVMLTAALDVRIRLNERLLVLFGMVAANACVVMSGSRAAILAIICVEGVLFLISFTSGIRGAGIAVANLVLSCIGWGVAFGLQRSADVVIDFNAVLHSNDSALPNARVEFWRTAWKLILKNPLLGYGENAWWPTVHSLQSQGAFPSSVRVLGHAHNEMLNAAFCYGVPFACVYALLACCYSCCALRRLRNSVDAGAMVTLFIIIVVVVFGMFESVFWHPECVRLNFVLGFVPLVVLLNSSRYGKGFCG